MQYDETQDIAVLEVSDVSGQKSMTVNDVPSDAVIQDIIEQLLDELQLPRNDTNGRALSYHALLERGSEARHLLLSERAGTALREGDRLTLMPDIDAGGDAS